MREIYKALIPIIALIGFFTPLSIHANMIIGADIEWQYLGNDSFEIMVHTYTDCNNSSSLSGTYLTYFSPGETCVPNPANTNESVCCGIDITPICINGCDRCSNSSCSFPFGIEEFTITSTVYLTANCCIYTIAWSGISLSRSSNITTGAANNDFYIDANLNRCTTPALSSPYFSEPPITIFCENQCIVYNAGVVDQAVDSAGRPDSLSYRLASPQSSQGTDIQYSSPYSYDAPVIYAGTAKYEPYVTPYCYGFHFDSTNGTMEFKAVKTDVTVYVLAVDIYRRNSKGVEQNVGEIKRDIELILLDCPSDIPPVITGINGGSSYSINICSGQQTCFSVKAFDLKLSDTVKMIWNNPETMNGATFSLVQNGQKWPTAIFCWSPKKSDIRSYPYNFVATAIDNICPIPGRVSKVFSIYVSGQAPTANYSTTVQKCGLVNFQANVASNSLSTIASYIWTGDSTMGAQPLHINGKTASYQYNSPGTYHYTLTITGPSGCSVIYKDSVIISKIPVIKLAKDTTVCINTKLLVKAIPSDYVGPYTIDWNTGDTGAVVNYYITKDTVLVAGIRDASGCTIYDSMRITTSPLPDANWFMNYLGNEAYFHARDSSLADPDYFWTFGDGNIGTGHSIRHLYPKNQAYTVSLIVTNSNGCINEVDSTLDIVYSSVETADDKNFLLSIYPNPFSSSTALQYTLIQPSKVSIVLYDVTGRQIANIKNESEDPGQYKTNINAEKYHLNPGVYFLKIMTDDGYVSRQIVKF